MSKIEHNFDNCPFKIALPRLTKDPERMIVYSSLIANDYKNQRLTVTDISFKSQKGEDLFLSHMSWHINEESSTIKMVLEEDTAAYHNLSEGLMEIKLHDSNNNMYIVLFEIGENIPSRLVNIEVIEHFNDKFIMQALQNRTKQ